MKFSIEVLEGVGALGCTYNACPYWRRKEGTPQLRLSLWFTKAIITLPWKHCMPIGHGSYSYSWGIFWWPSMSNKIRFSWGS